MNIKLSTVTKLQIVTFFAGLIGGFTYGQELYVLAALCGMTSIIALVLIFKETNP